MAEATLEVRNLDKVILAWRIRQKAIVCLTNDFALKRASTLWLDLPGKRLNGYWH